MVAISKEKKTTKTYQITHGMMGLSLPDHYHQWRNQDGAFGPNASILDPHCGGAILLLIEILNLVRYNLCNLHVLLPFT